MTIAIDDGNKRRSQHLKGEGMDGLNTGLSPGRMLFVSQKSKVSYFN